MSSSYGMREKVLIQGIILGSLLSIVYVSDPVSITKDIVVEPLDYADDKNFVFSGEHLVTRFDSSA